MRTARRVFIRVEHTAQRRLHAKDAEERGACLHQVQTHRLSFACEDLARARRGGNALERACGARYVREVGPRHDCAMPFRHVVDTDQAVRLRIRQRLEQHAVHNAEDRAVGPDTEAERHDRDDGEAGCLEESSQGVANVLAQVVHEGEIKASPVPGSGYSSIYLIWLLLEALDGPQPSRPCVRPRRVRIPDSNTLVAVTRSTTPGAGARRDSQSHKAPDLWARRTSRCSSAESPPARTRPSRGRASTGGCRQTAGRRAAGRCTP